MSLRFDTSYYLEQNPDVAAALEAGTVPGAEWHYIHYGTSEGRDPNAVFDTSDYLEANPDVATAFEAGSITPFEHFLSYGAGEGRAPNADYQAIAAGFEEAAYLTANPDVAAAVNNGTLASGYAHWVKYGQFEAAREATYSQDGASVPTPRPSEDETETVDVVTGDMPVERVVASLAAGAERDAGQVGVDEDVLEFSGIDSADALAAATDGIRFVDNGVQVSASRNAGDVDMVLDFRDGGSLTFVDFLAAATIADETRLSAPLPSGESAVLTGVSGDDVSMLFGASLTFSA